MNRKRLRIVSGGQTGVDQGALDAALAAGNECGGWCPEGRRSEAGPIPGRYPVRELAGADYRERTLKNVLESDGTAIVHNGELEGGTRVTAEYCRQHSKPLVEIDRAALTAEQAVAVLRAFIDENDIAVLNVAGPRRSKWKDAQRISSELIAALLSE